MVQYHVLIMWGPFRNACGIGYQAHAKSAPTQMPTDAATATIPKEPFHFRNSLMFGTYGVRWLSLSGSAELQSHRF